MLLRPKTKIFSITETLILGKVVIVQRGFCWQYTFQHYTMQGRGGWSVKKIRAVPQGENKGGASV